MVMRATILAALASVAIMGLLGAPPGPVLIGAVAASGLVLWRAVGKRSS